jgi:putative membrane protein
MPHLHPQESTIGVFVSLSLALIAVVYVRGWTSTANTAWRSGNFFMGLFAIWLAVGSPLGTLDHAFLTVHMIQHLLLMTIAPPLLFLGAGVLLLWRGLPEFGRSLLRPIRHLPEVKPVFCWLAATIVLAAWHVPALFSLGMRSNAWHIFEHASFFVAGLLFWWPVIRPWPSGKTSPGWSIVLYLFLATLPCDILSGFLVFSERVAYPVYLSSSTDLAVLSDQQCAGALMWTVVTLVYLVAGGIIATHLLSPGRDFQSVEVL